MYTRINYGTSQCRNHLETKKITNIINPSAKEIQIKELDALTGFDSFCAIYTNLYNPTLMTINVYGINCYFNRNEIPTPTYGCTPFGVIPTPPCTPMLHRFGFCTMVRLYMLILSRLGS